MAVIGAFLPKQTAAPKRARLASTSEATTSTSLTVRRAIAAAPTTTTVKPRSSSRVTLDEDLVTTTCSVQLEALSALNDFHAGRKTKFETALALKDAHDELDPVVVDAGDVRAIDALHHYQDLLDKLRVRVVDHHEDYKFRDLGRQLLKAGDRLPKCE